MEETKRFKYGLKELAEKLELKGEAITAEIAYSEDAENAEKIEGIVIEVKE